MTLPPAAFAVHSVPSRDPTRAPRTRNSQALLHRTTYDAARAFRLTGHPRYLSAVSCHRARASGWKRHVDAHLLTQFDAPPWKSCA